MLYFVSKTPFIRSSAPNNTTVHAAQLRTEKCTVAFYKTFSSSFQKKVKLYFLQNILVRNSVRFYLNPFNLIFVQ